MPTQKYKNLYDEHLDDVDAAIFSGDIFFDMDNRRSFRELISRWLCELEKIEKIRSRDYK